MNSIQIHSFQAYDGDSFLVTIQETEKKIHLLIDCGSYETYEHFIKPYLLAMAAQGEIIDYLILTHVHSDHIGGAVPLLLENGGADEARIIKISHVIYNGYLGLSLENGIHGECSAKESRICRGIISQGQVVLGSRLTEKPITLNEEVCISKLLVQGGYCWNAWNQREQNLVLADSQMKLKIGSQSYLQFLSPNRQQLIRMNEKWKAYMKRIYRRYPEVDNLQVRTAFEAFQWIVNQMDYDIISQMVSEDVLTRNAIEALAVKKDSYDYTDENMESIAFVLVSGEQKVLFLGDANIEVCRKNLEQIYGKTPTKIDLIKLSHHGSKRNLSMNFLRQFPSDSYLISAGKTALRPSMETIARILVNHPERNKKIYILNRNDTIECFDQERIHSEFPFEFIDAKDMWIQIPEVIT